MANEDGNIRCGPSPGKMAAGIPFSRRSRMNEPGTYTFAADVEAGPMAGGSLSTCLMFRRWRRRPVATWGIDDNICKWLAQHGVTSVPFVGSDDARRQVVLVDDLEQAKATPEQRRELLRRVARGSVAIYLSSAPSAMGQHRACFRSRTKGGAMIFLTGCITRNVSQNTSGV